jgi:hypothetical protein
MEKLVEKSARKINTVSIAFKRYLYNEINKSNRSQELEEFKVYREQMDKAPIKQQL